MDFNLGSSLVNLFTGPGTPLDALFGTGGSPGLFSNPTGAWDQFKNGQTNVVNKQIADENLEYQRELQEYQKALQQQIFEREDTAYQRTAADMAAAGINPLMMKQTNGAGAEVPITPLHNDFQMQDQGIGPLLTLLNSMSSLHSDSLQRDKLQEEVDAQRLDNQAKALDNQYKEERLKDEQEARKEENRHKKTINPSEESSAKAKASRDVREDWIQENYGSHDLSSNVNQIATDTAYQADRALNGIGQAANSVGEKVSGAAEKAQSFFKEKFDNAVEAVENWADSAKNNTKSWWQKHKEKHNNHGKQY